MFYGFCCRAHGQGRVSFKELVVKGGVGNIYEVSATCGEYPNLFANLSIGPCLPGSSLNAQVLVRGGGLNAFLARVPH